jgi:hypothetical protein
MSFDATERRRWFGGIVLAAALLMLLGGETILSGRLSPSAFFIYWLVCLLFTAVAMVVAFRDLRALQHRANQERRNLLETTLKTIENDKVSRLASHSKGRAGLRPD